MKKMKNGTVDGKDWTREFVYSMRCFRRLRHYSSSSSLNNVSTVCLFLTVALDHLYFSILCDAPSYLRSKCSSRMQEDIKIVVVFFKAQHIR